MSKKRALIIGIEYRDSNRVLEDAHHYARKMRLYLVQKLQWKEKSIHSLLDQPQNPPKFQPTKTNILNTCFKLIEKTKEDDVLFIYYCGYASWITTSKKEVLLPVDHVTQGFILDSDLQNMLKVKLESKAKCLIIIDAAQSGYHANLAKRVVPRNMPRKQKLLLVDYHGHLATPIGILGICTEHDQIFESQIVLFTSKPVGNDVVVYGLLTDYFINRISQTSNYTFAALLAKIGKDFENIKIGNQVPVIALSQENNDVLDQRVRFFL